MLNATVTDANAKLVISASNAFVCTLSPNPFQNPCPVIALCSPAIVPPTAKLTAVPTAVPTAIFVSVALTVAAVAVPPQGPDVTHAITVATTATIVNTNRCPQRSHQLTLPS